MSYRSFSSSLSLLALTASLAVASPLPAMAEDSEEIKLLREEISLLKARLEALEGAQVKTTAPVTGTVAAPHSSTASSSPSPVVVTGTPAPAGVIPANPAPLAIASPKTATPSAPPPADFPGAITLPGTQTAMKISGYAKLDAIHDVDHAYGAQFARFAAIPLENSTSDNFDGQTNFHARQSRIGFETRTPTPLGAMKTFIEVDFFGSANGNPNTTNGEGIQLRHAYGSVGKVLAGQTWSNFMDLDAYPESLDYVGPAGLTFIRQAQVRYTDVKDNFSYAFALENPHSDSASPTTTRVSVDDIPDVTARLQYKGDFGHVALRGLARHLVFDDTTTRNESDGWGWGVGLSGKLNSFGKDAFLFQAVYGEGIGRYQFDVALGGNGVVYTPTEAEAQEVFSGYAAYQHYWTPTLRSNLIGGYTTIDNNIALTGTGVNEEIASAHINLIWNPFPAYKVGIEYMHGYRALEDGREGELNRIQSSFVYSF